VEEISLFCSHLFQGKTPHGMPAIISAPQAQ
jgi:hypothetical protein